jgi:hypothetical protein
VKKLLAIGLAACFPVALSAEDPSYSDALLGTTSVLVIDEVAPIDVHCAPAAKASGGSNCMAFSRAVLTAHTQKVSTLRERGRWM